MFDDETLGLILTNKLRKDNRPPMVVK